MQEHVPAHLLHGLVNGEKQRIGEFSALNLGGEINAAHAGQIRAELARLEMTIGPYDQLIAGHARSQGLVLVTNNEKEFARVPGLRTENWVL